MSNIDMRVTAQGSGGFYFQISGPSPVIPRVGERVKFSDGYGRVKMVTWEPPTSSAGDIKVIVECVPWGSS